MNLNVIALIVSFLDRYDDTKAGETFIKVKIPDLSENEKKEIDAVWLRNTKFESFEDKEMFQFRELRKCWWDGPGDYWTANGKLHREEKDEDGMLLPALITDDSEEWFFNGVQHRDEIYRDLEGDAAYFLGRQAPAVRRWNKPIRHSDETDTSTEWWKNGLRHRDEKDEDGHIYPAVIQDNHKEWWVEGKRHRDEKDEKGMSLPTVLGEYWQEWNINGKKHRTDRDENGLTLPARITSNGMEWWKNGKEHRVDRDENGHLLPAIITSNPYSEYHKLEWWIDGIRLRGEGRLETEIPKWMFTA